jgi:hypothetical protein
MTPQQIHQGPPRRSTVLAPVLAALTAVALAILVAKTLPGAAEYRGQIRTEAGDITLTIFSLVFLGVGGWQILHSRHH